ncbi:endolytic transglycosylase MltG [Streptomyces sp. NPDC017179]|uniref:endolytic transglycosylase MltG n=1 Tax=Streptomyces sp. NPDC017179 TaxID=3364979 RepID=UPI00379E99C8
MTEYGRDPGPEPWHPEDPLYGDGGWGGQQAQAGPQSPYGGGPQHHPQQSQQGQQAQYGDWGQGQQGGYGGQYQQQHYGDQGQQQGRQQYDPQGQQQYGQQDQQQYGQQDQQQYDPQGQQQYGQQGQQQYDQQYAGHLQQQGHDQGGWDGAGGQQQPAYPADPADPYGQQAAAYGAEQPDLYGTPEAYPPPEPPSRRRAEPEPRPDWDPDPEPEQDDHAFFAGGGGDDEEDADADSDDPKEGRGRGDRKGRGGKSKGKGKTKKRRSGCACMVVVLVFGGGTAGVVYYGYQFYQNRFGAAPDFAGDGINETVTVEIPKGAGGYDIGRVLKAAGVVKSVDAFVAAQAKNPTPIQDGIYTLRKQMSAASAVELMLSPKSRSNLVLAEGLRNTAIYTLIDKRLELPEGTTAGVANKEYKNLGLPSWALDHPNLKDPLEGFLYPSSYAVAKGQKPEAVLKEMVSRANGKYNELGLEKKAKGLDLEGPWQLLTVASLVQAEGKTHDDFRKMSEVIYNRLKPTNTETNRLLQFDSTFNYLKGQSNIHISEKEINSNHDPYNTYTRTGLPPGPIGNPGDEALSAALNPTDEGWIYFVATDGAHKTEFAKTYAEFLKLKDKFDATKGN